MAWSIHRATQRGSWMDPTVELLKELAPAVPHDMTVIVLCDRGISSPKLWKQIRAQGWHPCMRYRKNITFCADGGRRLPAQRFVSRPDTAWIGRGTAFSTPKAKRTMRVTNGGEEASCNQPTGYDSRGRRTWCQESATLGAVRRAPSA